MSTPGPDREDDRPRSSSTVRDALTRFAVLVVVTLLVVSVATLVAARALSHDIAVRHAKSRGTTFAHVVGGPLVDQGLMAGDPRSLAAFSRVMRNRLRDRSMAHIKVWDRSGRVVWTDETNLRGRTFSLEPDVRRLFRTGGAVASYSSLDKDENVNERVEGPLLEVYAAARSRDGSRVIVETYWSDDQIDDDARAVLLRLAPLPIGGLLLFAAVVLPLARSLARRVDEAQAQAQRSLQSALSASDLERRRVARDLHDGVLQDLSGVGYALSAISKTLPSQSGSTRRVVDDLTHVVVRVGESLRSLVADIYPAHLARDGIGMAVSDLAARCRHDGVAVEVSVEDGVEEVPLAVKQLSYRVVREGLRNVVRHSGGDEAEVRLSRNGTAVTVRVADNGRGLPERGPQEGHVGLLLLEDALSDVGGALLVGPGPAGGTVLQAQVPLDLMR